MVIMTRLQKAFETLFDQCDSAESYGFVWDNPAQLVDHAREECNEIIEALKEGNKTRIADEAGDLLRLVITLCWQESFEVADVLEKANLKFAGRFKTLQTIVNEKGLADLKGISLKTAKNYWQEAKKRLGSV